MSVHHVLLRKQSHLTVPLQQGIGIGIGTAYATSSSIYKVTVYYRKMWYQYKPGMHAGVVASCPRRDAISDFGMSKLRNQARTKTLMLIGQCDYYYYYSLSCARAECQRRILEQCPIYETLVSLHLLSSLAKNDRIYPTLRDSTSAYAFHLLSSL